MSNQNTQPTKQITDDTVLQYLPCTPEHLAAMLETYRSGQLQGLDIMPVAQNEMGEIADILLAWNKNCENEETKKVLEFAIQKAASVYIAIQYARERIDELLTEKVHIESK